MFLLISTRETGIGWWWGPSRVPSGTTRSRSPGPRRRRIERSIWCFSQRWLCRCRLDARRLDGARRHDDGGRDLRFRRARRDAIDVADSRIEFDSRELVRTDEEHKRGLAASHEPCLELAVVVRD